MPDHISLWGSLLKFRRDFEQYVNLRPVRLFPGVPCPLANKQPGDIDFYVVRENTEGILLARRADVRRHRTRDGIRIGFHPPGRGPHPEIRLRAGAAAPRKRLTAATKSNGMAISMPYWDERVAEMARQY